MAKKAAISNEQRPGRIGMATMPAGAFDSFANTQNTWKT
jgi:hypothetical protein